MTLANITPPTLEPLTLEEIKLHLRIDHEDEDLLLQETLKAARLHVELASDRKLITQTWRQYETRFPSDYLVPLRLTPVQSINAVTVFDCEGQTRVLDSQATQLVRSHEPNLVSFDPTFDAAEATNGLEIDVTAGMGDLGIDVDSTLKRAILLLVAHWYEFRGAVSPAQQPVSLPPGFDALVAPYRRFGL